MEIGIFKEIQKTGFSLWKHQQEYRHEFILNNLELQSVSRQISILRFFSQNIQSLPSNYSPISFANAMKQNPTKYLDKFSTRQYLYLHDLLIKMIAYPHTMSNIVSNYFTKDDVDLNFFARVTFPSIFHNFVTDALHKAGALFVNCIILNQPTHLIKAFMLSFIEISSDFLSSIWINFEINVNEFRESHKSDKIEHSECLVDIFISSLSKSLLYLSISQIELFKSLLKRSKELFGIIVIQNMLINSYIEYYQDKIKEPKFSAIYQMLETAGYYPNSSFFNKIADAIISPKYTKTRPSHRESGFTNQVPIVLSLHELYIIQRIMLNGYNAKNNAGHENTETNGNSHAKIDQKSDEILNVYKPINTQKLGGFTILDAQTCKNHFEPLYLDLDITSFFTKSAEPVEGLLFSSCLQNQPEIPSSGNENIHENINSKNEKNANSSISNSSNESTDSSNVNATNENTNLNNENNASDRTNMNNENVTKENIDSINKNTSNESSNLNNENNANSTANLNKESFTNKNADSNNENKANNISNSSNERTDSSIVNATNENANLNNENNASGSTNVNNESVTKENIDSINKNISNESSNLNNENNANSSANLNKESFTNKNADSNNESNITSTNNESVTNEKADSSNAKVTNESKNIKNESNANSSTNENADPNYATNTNKSANSTNADESANSNKENIISCAKEINSISKSENNSSEDKDVQKFIKDFDLYLCHLSMGKFIKSLLREKKLDLFVTLGLYSRQCVDHSAKKHKSIDWKAIFAPPPLHRDFSLTLNLKININLPKSMSIGNLHHPNNSSSELNKDEKEKSEKEIQKDLEQLKLNKDVKEKLSKLLKKYGRPNDALSMFVLVRQLDVYESIYEGENKEESKEKIENKNDDEEENSHKISYLDLHYHDSFQKFKETIKKMNESSENLIHKVDKNGYFLKFIEKCSCGIDSLANSSHFEMIFGLLFVGLELNEISVHISENEIVDKVHIFNIMKPFINCLFMHSNDQMFDVFVWYKRFINTFPEIKQIIPKKSRTYVDLLIDYFYENFKFEENNEK